MGLDYADAFGAMTLLDGQITTTNTSAIFPPGQIFYWRGGTDRKNTALVKWVQLDNNGCSQGEALISDLAVFNGFGVAKAGTGDGRLPEFRGIAAATIASNAFGFMIIGGYCEKADLSLTCATGEMLSMSGSTAGKLSPNKASSNLNATLGTSVFVTIPFVVAIAKTSFATGVGSVQIIGIWG
jgi:hypothetical protein